MAVSLKSLYPVLSPILGETESALYAKQRSFVFSEILDCRPGRGPGAGVPASGRTVAQFLIAYSANAGQAENVSVAKTIAKAAGEFIKSPVTGQVHITHFIDTLTGMLSERALAERIDRIHIELTGSFVRIFYKDEKDEAVALFLMAKGKSGDIRFEVTIPGDLVRKLAKIVADIPKDA